MKGGKTSLALLELRNSLVLVGSQLLLRLLFDENDAAAVVDYDGFAAVAV